MSSYSRHFSNVAIFSLYVSDADEDEFARIFTLMMFHSRSFTLSTLMIVIGGV